MYPGQAMFRAALLPHPDVNSKAFPKTAFEFALSAVVPLAIFVAYHLVMLRNPHTVLACAAWPAACAGFRDSAQQIPSLRRGHCIAALPLQACLS